MENNSPTISKELQEQIEREAEQYMLEWNRFPKGELSSGRLYEAYLSGATAYAHYKERWEQAKKALEDIASGKVLPHLIAQQTLASWKEEGKDDFGNWLERCCKP